MLQIGPWGPQSKNAFNDAALGDLFTGDAWLNNPSPGAPPVGGIPNPFPNLQPLSPSFPSPLPGGNRVSLNQNLQLGYGPNGPFNGPYIEATMPITSTANLDAWLGGNLNGIDGGLGLNILSGLEFAGWGSENWKNNQQSGYIGLRLH
jgi:hypothetical protein